MEKREERKIEGYCYCTRALCRLCASRGDEEELKRRHEVGEFFCCISGSSSELISCLKNLATYIYVQLYVQTNSITDDTKRDSSMSRMKF